MTNAAYPLPDLRDIESLNAYRDLRAKGRTDAEAMAAIHRMGRDNARTPMQWTAGPNAGFTDGTPWMRVNPNHVQINARAALDDPDSVFYTYQKLIALRKAYPVFVEGDFTLLCPQDEQVFAYLRRGAGQELLAAVNLSGPAGRLCPAGGLCRRKPAAGHPRRPGPRRPAPLGGAALPAQPVSAARFCRRAPAIPQLPIFLPIFKRKRSISDRMEVSLCVQAVSCCRSAACRGLTASAVFPGRPVPLWTGWPTPARLSGRSYP